MSSKASKGKSSSKKADFPSDWPIDAKDPSQGLIEQSTLAPGPLLHASSGADVFVVKAASQKKTIPQNYLCLLPGTLQLNTSGKKDESTTQSHSQDGCSTDDEDGTNNDQIAFNGKKARLFSQLLTLGVVENFATKPVLSLSLGHASNEASSASILQFDGQHVDTNSKFLVVSFQPTKKKQRVAVKHVFGTVIIFGNGTLIGGDPPIGNDPAAPYDLGEGAELDHYGGSNRTKQAESAGKWITNDTEKMPRQGMTTLAGLTETESDDEESEILISTPAFLSRRTSLSRQSKSNRKNLAYNENEGDEEDDLADNSEEDKCDASNKSSHSDLSSAQLALHTKQSSRARQPATRASGTKITNIGSVARSARKNRTFSDESETSVLELSSDTDDENDNNA
ncbi:hypothetical protein MPSEU_000347000 [Mayamaea pseudoterrestris]|nr:hypothetical protein MPSEU_000347000 [Mayamaea pseudoterrestris]